MARVHIADEAVEVVLEVTALDLGKTVTQLSHILAIAERVRELHVDGEIVLTFTKQETP